MLVSKWPLADAGKIVGRILSMKKIKIGDLCINASVDCDIFNAGRLALV